MSRSSSNYGKETFQDSVLIESVEDEEKESSMKVLEDPIDKQELPGDKEISRTDSFLSPLEKDFIESYAPECYPPSGDEERESSKKVWDNPTYKEELLSEKEISPTDTFLSPMEKDNLEGEEISANSWEIPPNPTPLLSPPLSHPTPSSANREELPPLPPHSTPPPQEEDGGQCLAPARRISKAIKTKKMTSKTNLVGRYYFTFVWIAILLVFTHLGDSFVTFLI